MTLKIIELYFEHDVDVELEEVLPLVARVSYSLTLEK